MLLAERLRKIGLEGVFVAGRAALAALAVAGPAGLQGHVGVLKLVVVVAKRTAVVGILAQDAPLALGLGECFGVGAGQLAIHATEIVSCAAAKQLARSRRSRERAEQIAAIATKVTVYRPRQRQALVLAQVVVQAQRAVVPVSVAFARAVLGQGRAILLAIAPELKLVGVVPSARIGRGREPELALLEVERGTQAGVAVASRGPYPAVEALVHALFQHDVDDAGRAFAVVFGRRRGDDFDALNLVSGNAFQRFSQVAGQRGRGLVVHQHLKVAGAAHRHLTVAVHGQQGGLAQYIGRRAAGVSHVLVGVVYHAVGAHFHHWLRADDDGLPERRARGGQAESADIGGSGRDGYGPRLGAVAHVAYPQAGRAGRKLGERKAAIVVGGHARDGFVVGRGGQQHHRGVGHSRFLKRIEHHAGERAGGRNGGGWSRRGLSVSSGRQPGTAGQHQTQNEVALHQEKRDRIEAE